MPSTMPFDGQCGAQVRQSYPVYTRLRITAFFDFKVVPAVSFLIHHESLMVSCVSLYSPGHVVYCSGGQVYLEG